MKDLYSIIYKVCIIASLVSFIIAIFTRALGAYIVAYSVLTLAIMMILIILFSNVLRNSSNISLFQTSYSILMTSGPFLLILAVISFILYLLINYRGNIIEKNISPSYNSYNNIIVLLLLLQMYFIYNSISSDSFGTTSKISNTTTSIMYLLGVLTGVCSIILYTILKYYTTDGFTSIS